MKKQKRARRTGRRKPHAGEHAGEPRSGAVLEATVERILPGGSGLAHSGGQTLLVALAAPGDRLRVRVERVQGRVAFASITEILAPSPVRVEPLCPYFGRCGGCDFQQMSYEAQLASKVEIIRDCLRRIARIEVPLDIPIEGSPAIWQYRSRAQWQHDPQKGELGYFERGSHRVCDVAACPVLVPGLQSTLEGLREQLVEGLLPEGVTEFQAVAGDEGISLAPPVPGQPLLEVSRRIGPARYRFSAEGFFQINHELLETLIAAAMPEAQGETAVDLYCGAGLFTLPLARRFTRVIGVEANASAIHYARRNIEDAAVLNATFEISKVGDWLEEQGRGLSPVDFVLLDPPRAGAEEGVIDGILRLKARRISYVSCDPATLARDLRGLIEGGYRLESLAAFDMFPQTHHVETVAHLTAA
jgi:23S rRNA (uracil1939-C5)-methyltransferase